MLSGDASAVETADGKYKTRRARVKRPCSTFSSVRCNKSNCTSNSVRIMLFAKLHFIHTLLLVVHLSYLAVSSLKYFVNSRSSRLYCSRYKQSDVCRFSFRDVCDCVSYEMDWWLSG